VLVVLVVLVVQNWGVTSEDDDYRQRKRIATTT
jgi:hypothetical protein